MKYKIHSPEDVGLLLRAARKSAKVRLDDLSHTVDVSKQTTVNVEKGKSTVQIGTVIRLLHEMGLQLTVDLPESALPALARVQHEAATRASAEATRVSRRSEGRVHRHSPATNACEVEKIEAMSGSFSPQERAKVACELESFEAPPAPTAKKRTRR